MYTLWRRNHILKYQRVTRDLKVTQRKKRVFPYRHTRNVRFIPQRSESEPSEEKTFSRKDLQPLETEKTYLCPDRS